MRARHDAFHDAGAARQGSGEFHRAGGFAEARERLQHATERRRSLQAREPRVAFHGRGGPEGGRAFERRHGGGAVVLPCGHGGELDEQRRGVGLGGDRLAEQTAGVGQVAAGNGGPGFLAEVDPGFSGPGGCGGEEEQGEPAHGTDAAPAGDHS